MSVETIKEILETMRLYHTVNITQTFSKDGQDVLLVACFNQTKTFKVTNLSTNATVFFENTDEAASVIDGQLH